MTAEQILEKHLLRMKTLQSVYDKNTGQHNVLGILINELTEQLALSNVVGQSEQLPILDRCGCEEPNEEPIKVCMNCNGYVE